MKIITKFEFLGLDMSLTYLDVVNLFGWMDQHGGQPPVNTVARQVYDTLADILRKTPK